MLSLGAAMSGFMAQLDERTLCAGFMTSALNAVVNAGLAAQTLDLQARRELVIPPPCLHNLPDILLHHIFSFLTVREHFAIVATQSAAVTNYVPSRCAATHAATARERPSLKRPPRKARAPTAKLACRYRDSRSSSGRRGNCCRRLSTLPDHVLSRLARLGFRSVSVCGAASLRLLANPVTTELVLRAIDLSNCDLLPLEQMHKVDLKALRNLSIKQLRIELLKPTEKDVLSVDLRETLEALPLSKLFIYGFSQKDFFEYLPLRLKVRNLGLSSCNVDDTLFAQLAEYENLRSFEASYTDITGVGLSSLKGLPLRELILKCNDLAEENLRHLKDLAQLTSLEVSHNSRISGSFLTSLQSLPIERLSLRGLNMEEKNFHHLKSMHSLRSLYLCDSKNMTGRGLAYLSSAQTSS
eukprot:g20283.t1